MKEYRTGAGRQIRLTSVLGKGGEGTVFHVDSDNDVAAKVYTDGNHLERRDKISTMVADELYKRSALVAFPIQTLFEGSGAFVGFTMRKVGGVKPIHELYAPGSRKIEFPKADFRFLARTATNVARAIASVHQTGCVIGDINHSGILVSDQATVTLIDADSFQVRSGTVVYRCRVGVGEYTPPELQGAALDKVDRDQSHDGFGLAVIAFQLLFMGRHPFAGRYSGHGDMPIEKAIKEGRFAYSVQRKSETRMDPPPFAPTLGDLTPDLASTFERAFSSNPRFFQNRPNAAEWIAALSRFETELTPCRVNPAHHHPKNAPGCPWCRLENGMGVSLFPGAGSSSASATARNFDLTMAIAAIDRVLGPGPAPDPTGKIPLPPKMKRSQAAKEIRRNHFGRRVGGLMFAALCALLMAGGLSIAFLGLFLAAYLVFGGGEAYQQLQRAKTLAENDWSAALRDWNSEAGAGQFEQKKVALKKLGGEYRELPALEKSRLDDLERRRREIQLQRFLEGHLIARAKISGIGDGRKATLASYGIEDAFDVSYHKVLAVPGFGDATTGKLVSWRASIERRFVFNPAAGADPTAVRQVKDGIAQRRAEIEQALTRGPVELEQLRVHAMTARGQPTQRLISSYQALQQAIYDLP
ncbi:helix-hairpin-helix domain-containing protein [Jiella mangrovi]|uniref:Protein kinase domain-containing protein n=1 Tax=Jiella mangrovi TaxID=2821407 RepID=A0ABS4BG68_9HYPH|nr:protein kinase domain-containing protein [Jiella mangrovi]MBP0615748.1 protein kinase domain-containing protein [Jiella mangrovi]